MDEKKLRHYAGLSGIIFSILLCAIYIYVRRVPFLDAYLDADRRRYFLLVYVLAVIGVFAYLAAKDKVEGWRLKIPLYSSAFVFFVGVPVSYLIFHGTGSRGWEWAITTFFIGLIPAMFIIFGFNIYFGYRKYTMALMILFLIMIVAYVFLFLVQVGLLGKVDHPVRFVDILIVLIIISFSVLSFYINLKSYKLD